MKCPVCSAELPSTAKFCGGCGTTLTAPAPPPAFSSEPTYQQPGPIPSAPPGYVGNMPPAMPGYVGSMPPAGPMYGSPPPAVQKKYKVLRLISVLIKVFAFIAAAIFIILGLVMLVAGAATSARTTSSFEGTTTFNPGGLLFSGVVGGLIMFIYGVFVFVFLYAYSEWMYVFMDIEENTRITNAMLSERR